MRTLNTLAVEEARLAIEAMRAELGRRGTPASVAVTDVHGDVLVLERLDGAPATSSRIALHKAWTSANQRVPSRAIGARVRSAEQLDVAYFGDARICGFAGGLPVVVDGAVVGAVGVSGLPEDEDEAVARVGVLSITPS